MKTKLYIVNLGTEFFLECGVGWLFLSILVIWIFYYFNDSL